MNAPRYMLLLGLVTLFALLGVAQRARAVHLGYQIGRLETKKQTLAEGNRFLLCEISALSDPARIAGEVGRMKIELLDPVEFSRGRSGDRTAERAVERRREASSSRRR